MKLGLYPQNVPHDERDADDMNEDVDGVRVVGSIKSELLESVGSQIWAERHVVPVSLC
jgi:hypothetical protein